jgi:hypothetical protein
VIAFAEAPERVVVKLCAQCWEQVPMGGHHAHGDGLTPHREEEVVPLARHEAEIEATACRAIRIYWRSLAEARSDYPDYIVSEGDEACTYPGGRENRAQIIRDFAADFGVNFEDVSCHRVWMRVDTDLIEDEAAQVAARPEDYGDDPIAYTWQGEGWSYEICERTDEGAIGMYRCEVKERSA